MAKHRVEQHSQQRGGKRNQCSMKSEPPVGIREGSYPSPRPHEPEALNGIDRQKKQRKEKNSAKNQGKGSSRMNMFTNLDAFCDAKTRPHWKAGVARDVEYR